MLYFNVTITLVLILLAFWKRNSRPLFIIIFVWLWWLFTFNCDNADYAMYNDLYDGTLKRPVEPGMMFLFSVFSGLGLPYHVFLGVFGAVGLGLIAMTIKRFSKNVSLVAALYSIFPFVFDAIQIRNFMALALVIFGIRFLVEKKRYWWLKYLLLNILAISIHSYSLICLAFIPLNMMKQKQISIVTGVLLIVETAIALNKPFLIWLLSFVMDPYKLNAYFLDNRYTPGISTIICSILIIAVSLYLAYKFSRQTNGNTGDRYNEICLKIFTISVLFIPILWYSTTTMRFVRSMTVLLLIGITNYMVDVILHRRRDSIKDKRLMLKNMVMPVSCMAVLVFVWNYAFIFGINNQKVTYGAVFGNNILEKTFSEND